MGKYTTLSADELEALAKKEDPWALYEIAMRFKGEKNLALARKFFIFAAHLGHGKASVELGSIYESEDNVPKAIDCYRFGLTRGEIDITCKLATLLIDENEQFAVDILMSSAVLGNEASIAMLEEYYTEIGDLKEAKFWKGKRGGKK